MGSHVELTLDAQRQALSQIVDKKNLYNVGAVRIPTQSLLDIGDCLCIAFGLQEGFDSFKNNLLCNP